MPQKKSALKILQFCNKPSFPPKDGGAIGMNNVSEGLIEAGFNLKILSANSKKHFVEVANLPNEYITKTSFEAVMVDLEIHPVKAIMNLLFSNRSYNIIRFYNNELAQRLIEILKETDFDFVQIESIFLKDYIPIIRANSKAKIILRAPNVEHVIWERLAEIETNNLKKAYLKMLSKRLKAEEIFTFNQVDAIYTVTPEDQLLIESLGIKIPITFVPTGIDVTKNLELNEEEVEFPSLFHIGALDWFPNQEAIKWLLQNVWPQLHSEFPNLKFYIAGRRPPKWMTNLQVDGVEVIGEVENADQFIKSKAIMPVPLFSGSGMRVKIIEAMMLKKAVITTSIGIEGIIHHDGQNVLIANTADEFLMAIRKLISDRIYYQGICNQAFENANRHYSNKILTDKLVDFLTKLK